MNGKRNRLTEHFSNIFNIEKGEINLDAIKAGWQTGTSEKVTRMAFNLWNHSIMFDSEEDLENEKRLEAGGNHHCVPVFSMQRINVSR